MAWPDSLDLVLRIVSIPLLLLVNAFFVATEFCLVTVRPTRVREMVQKGVPGAKRLQRAASDRERVIAATQVGITIASLALGWVGEPVLARFFGAALAAGLGIDASPALAHSLAVATAFALITYLHVLLGEQVPKSLALQRPAETGLVLAGPYLVTERLFRPFIWVLYASGNLIVRLAGMKPLTASQRVHSADELKMIVASSLQGGALGAEQGDILRRALDLPVRRVRDIMVPRERIVAVDVHTPQDRLLEFVAEQGYTRMPVFDGSLDRVVGVVHAKDLFTITASKGLIILEDIVREPYFVAPDLEVTEILRGFRSQHVHLAVVRDAAGRVEGLVTLEDVLEQLVGYIADEHDTVWGTGEAPAKS
jgi:CBS domain containing-hemolysin-like protein